jgi:hypothetical protein
MLLRNPPMSHLRCLSGGEFKKCIPSRLLNLPPVRALSRTGLLGLGRQRDTRVCTVWLFGTGKRRGRIYHE